MNSEEHYSLVTQISKNVESLYKYEGKELQWSVFRDDKSALLTVCTPKSESISFIPVTQFYYKLLMENKPEPKTCPCNPRVHSFKRAVVISIVLPEGFSGRIRVFAGIDNYPPFQAEITWGQ